MNIFLRWYFWVTFLLLVLLDQISKLIFQKLGHLTYNKKFIFGIFDFGPFTLWLSVLLLIVLLAFLSRTKKFYFKIAAVLLLAGGVSNLIDRIRLGATIDFVKIPLIPIFNLADFFITLGFIFFLLALLTWERK